MNVKVAKQVGILILVVGIILAVTTKNEARSIAVRAPERFPHAKHSRGFQTVGISCLDCHNFNIKSSEMDPLGQPVKSGHLAVSHATHCYSCHRPKGGPGATASENTTTYGLCTTCHKNKNVPSNHPIPRDTYCLSCHSSRSFAHKSLKNFGTSSGCTTCHRDRVFKHRTVTSVAMTSASENIRLEHDALTCMTCHSPHPTGATQKLVVGRERVMPFCASCHGETAQNLFQDFHRIIKKETLRTRK